MSAQLDLPGMPRRLFPATPSKLATFADCPRRYRFAYVERPVPPKGPPWAHNTVGSAVHAALRSWWDLPIERRTPAAARQLLYAGWSQTGFRDAEQAERWRARAAGWITDYVEGLDPADEPVGTERTVGATTERLALSGRVDRIDQRGNELVIVDYKTGRRQLGDDDAKASLALAVYVVAARRTLRRRARRVELHHLPTGTVAAHDHTEESLERHLRRAEAIAAEASAADAQWRDGLSELAEDAADGDADAIEAIDAVFPAAPGSMCSWCDFRRHCPSGREVSTALAPWDGLAS